MTTIAVAGATGTVGRHVVAALRAAEHRVVELSRSGGVDVLTGRGVAAALDDVDVVIDVLNVATQSAKRSEEFFAATTSTLLDAEQSCGVGHHVLLSIVGIENAPGGYYAGKLRQEGLVRSGTVPWTILRATQFHEFAGQLLARASIGPIALMPVAALRPVAAVDVAATLAGLAAGTPQRATIELRGPRDEQLVDMARRVVAARGERRIVVPLRLPGRVGQAMRQGVLRGDASAEQGEITFADWLLSTGRGR